MFGSKSFSCYKGTLLSIVMVIKNDYMDLVRLLQVTVDMSSAVMLMLLIVVQIQEKVVYNRTKKKNPVIFIRYWTV